MQNILQKTVYAGDALEYLTLIEGSAGTTSRATDIESVLGIGVNIVMGSAIAITFIASIISGIKFIVAKSNDPRSLETAKKSLMGSFVAFFIVISVFTFLGILMRTVGLSTTGNPYKLFRIFNVSSGNRGKNEPGNTPKNAPNDKIL